MVVTYAIPVTFSVCFYRVCLLQTAQARPLSRHRHAGQPLDRHLVAPNHSIYKDHLGRGVRAGLRAFPLIYGL